MAAFSILEDFLLPPPLPASLAVLMCLGLKYLGSRLASLLRRSHPQPLETAAGFMLVTGVVACISNLMAIFGFAHVWLLGTIAWGIACFGIIEIFGLPHAILSRMWPSVRNCFHSQPWSGKIGISLVLITVACLSLAALGPPTDADSLDYHLGLPLDILRHHRAYPRSDWLHVRLAGLGESLNLLGLAGGADIFGAALQLSGLAVALIAVISLAETDFDRILGAMLVVGCPVLLFLIPNQKPQMFPVAGITLALIMIVHRFQSIDAVTIVLAFTTVCFSMACKYSFLLTGSIVIAAGMIAAYKNNKVAIGVYAAVAGILVFLLPVYIPKFLFYGDPISPMLEHVFSGNTAVIEFANGLRNYRDSSRPFPLCLIVPDSIGTISTTLGLGTFLVLVGICIRGSTRTLLVCALISAALTLVVGQVASRFFLESYLWIASAFVASSNPRLKAAFFRIMVVQMLGVAAMAAFAAAILFPGSLSGSLRHTVMLRYAHQYGESRWLDSVLPKNVVVLTDLRSKALMPRPFLSSEGISCSTKNDFQALENLSFELESHGVRAWITFDPSRNPCLSRVFPILFTEPKCFRSAVRNPWNARTSSIVVYQSVPKFP